MTITVMAVELTLSLESVMSVRFAKISTSAPNAFSSRVTSIFYMRSESTVSKSISLGTNKVLMIRNWSFGHLFVFKKNGLLFTS